MDTVRDRGVPALSIEDPVVTVAAPDRPGLLAEVTGVLALHGLNVRSAVVAGEEGVAVEMFTAEPSLGRWPAAARLSDDLAAAMDGRLQIDAQLAERAHTYRNTRRPAAPQLVSTQVTVDNNASMAATVVEVRAEDVVGQLHRITRAFVECRLDVISAKVSTFGSAVVDAFYVRVRGRRQARRHTGDRSPRTNDRRGGGGPSAGVRKPPNGKVAVWSAGPTGSLSTGKRRLGCEDRFAMESKHAHANSERRLGGHAILRLAIALVALAALGVGIAAIAHGSDAASSPSGSGGAGPAPKALTVVSVSPANGTSDVPSDATLSVQFSAPLALHTPTPTLTPPVAGSWELVAPTTLAFVATSPLVPSSTETISVPAGSGGVSAASGNHLTLASTTQFTVAAGSTLRLQQLLAQLGYLPLSFTPAGPLSAPQEAANAQEGTFNWRWTEPASLEGLWAPGSPNTITRGAVMAFESHHDHDHRRLARTGRVDPAPRRRRRRCGQHRAVQLRLRLDLATPRRPPSTATVPTVYSTLGQHRGAGRADRGGHLPRLRSLHGDHHVRHQPRRVPLRRSGHPLGQLLQRRGRAPRLRARPATATHRATAASRCRSPTQRWSSRSPRSGPWSPSPERRTAWPGPQPGRCADGKSGARRSRTAARPSFGVGAEEAEHLQRERLAEDRGRQ